MRLGLAVVSILSMLSCAHGGTAQSADTATESPVFRALAGSWVGEGTLMGRPAAFTISWTPQADGGMRLDFTNAFRGADGATTPVLAAVATYAVDGGALVADWTDDRPQSIAIIATATDSALVSDWTAPSEEGRTEYRLQPDGTLVVRDWVRSQGELRPFGEAVYRRREG
jgi:hypothetical protein